MTALHRRSDVSAGSAAARPPVGRAVRSGRLRVLDAPLRGANGELRSFRFRSAAVMRVAFRRRTNASGRSIVAVGARRHARPGEPRHEQCCSTRCSTHVGVDVKDSAASSRVLRGASACAAGYRRRDWLRPRTRHAPSARGGPPRLLGRAEREPVGTEPDVVHRERPPDKVGRIHREQRSRRQARRTTCEPGERRAPIPRRRTRRVRAVDLDGNNLEAVCAVAAAHRLSRVAWDVLTEEQREIRELVRTLARERIAPRAAEIDESHEFPWDVVELFREHDIFGLLFDEEYGGTGTGALLALVAIEEVSKVCATSGLLLAVQELGSLGLKLGGHATSRRQRYLPRLASGEWLCRLRADRGGLGLRLRRDADDGAARRRRIRPRTAASASSRTRASRTSTPSSRRPTRTPATRASPRSSSRRTRPASRSTRLEPKMGIKGSTTGELSFDDCRVPAENLLGEEGEGFKIAMRILDRSRPGVAAQALGIAQGATDYALEYAKTRETMGKPIARAPADRRRSSPTWRRSARRRAASSTASGR